MTPIRFSISLFTMFLFTIRTSVSAELLTDPWFQTSNLSRIPGAFDDPFKGLILTTPSFTIPRLGGSHPVVGGMPQGSVGYTVNGCPLEFMNVSASPFHFYDYRSWFNGSSDTRFSVNPSYTPVEYGFFAGPMLCMESFPRDSNLSINTRANNYDAAVGFTTPIGKTAMVNARH